MAAVLSLAVFIAIGRQIHYRAAITVLPLSAQLLLYTHARGRCRAEGRPMSDADAEWQSLYRRAAVPVVVIALLGFTVFCFLGL